MNDSSPNAGPDAAVWAISDGAAGNERQALALLQSLKDEEARVHLDERKAARHVYKDW